MSIIELIQKAGEANVRVQPVADSLLQMKRKKTDAEITLATSHEMAAAVSREAAGIPGTHFGMIVWIPREKVPTPAADLRDPDGTREDRDGS